MKAWFIGDAEAFSLFYARHYHRVVGWLISRNLGRAEAEDVAQEAFLKLHARISQYDTSRPALPWFFAIVRGCWLDHLRREKRTEGRAQRWGHAINDGLFAGEAPADDLEEQRAAVAAALANLSATQKELVAERLYKETPYATMAANSGSSETSLRKAFERAMKKIRSQVFKGNDHG